MIPRYTRPEMGAIWTDENRYRIWLEIELLATCKQEELGIVPEGTSGKIREKARFDPARIDEIERETKHDVIAFLTNIAESAGPDTRYLHLGMTSSDVVDTAFSVQLVQAGRLILDDISQLIKALGARAREFKYTPIIGRTHGIHAEPTTFGLKLAVFYDEMNRAKVRMERAVTNMAVGKISGAVGTFEHLDPSVEEFVCAKMGLRPAPVSTQIVQRDHHAEYFTVLALVASSLEKIAVELRHLQRTEVREVEEYFSKGQKGSSAMPHKRNPITLERVSGLARLMRGYAMTAMENVALWHERDISHSSTERVIAPDATIALDYMLELMTRTIRTMFVYPEAMRRNLDLTRGLVFSQPVLLALAKSGLTREQAYSIVQRNAMQVWELAASGSQPEITFRSLLDKDADVQKRLTPQDLDHAFDPKWAARSVDLIFERVGL
ncbi:MAG: adenylosuccinate lyase [Bacteroidota bacterium]|nr:adenylosuccinate lyase [Bacteroidota bacterium]MDP4233934.1 adenylosuccinate lyase [Bacteroidota bacterium]MDP4242815.1 adenylosuccinate lyase [Bacteroidota bacterium]MDP4288293.1 adenylosuccinate lyase [Bacteroidota bacterium]